MDTNFTKAIPCDECYEEHTVGFRCPQLNSMYCDICAQHFCTLTMETAEEAITREKKEADFKKFVENLQKPCDENPFPFELPELPSDVESLTSSETDIDDEDWEELLHNASPEERDKIQAGLAAFYATKGKGKGKRDRQGKG